MVITRVPSCKLHDRGIVHVLPNQETKAFRGVLIQIGTFGGTQHDQSACIGVSRNCRVLSTSILVFSFSRFLVFSFSRFLVFSSSCFLVLLFFCLISILMSTRRVWFCATGFALTFTNPYGFFVNVIFPCL